jgi:hypothetical protein
MKAGFAFPVFAEKISRILDQFNIVSETIVLPIPDFG